MLEKQTSYQLAETHVAISANLSQRVEWAMFVGGWALAVIIAELAVIIWLLWR